MDEMTQRILARLRNECDDWPTTKDTVADFSFNDYVKRMYGFTYRGPKSTFQYTVVDEKLFAWFLLGCNQNA